ncbi:hypothetical protein Patl1_04725 [Pistacia atlantica]|uniref:Uncharacterized protein n=1 Tax=Pistacia atlantica TaxID=434234 RepID=A0ACC1BRR8_9ROSI|nr:hypothetical protein Patl1_04725 [Pistacia atlantica]
MRPQFRPLITFSRENLQQKFKFYIQFTNKPSIKQISYYSIISRETLNPYLNPINNFLGKTRTALFVHSLANTDNHDGEIVSKVQNILKNHGTSSEQEIENALAQCELDPSDDLVINVLNLNRFDWKPVYLFFKWVSRRSDYSPGCKVYNEMLDILGRTGRFEELIQVFDEMSHGEGLVNESTYGILLHRYAAAHKVEEAIGIFNKRKEFGFNDDLVAFQSLLMWLCRYKHVDDAETFFELKKKEFGFDIKTRNIILNGWCVLGNVHEAKRFWKDIIASKCEPDLFTYGTFINALTKKGKLNPAMRLFREMWGKGCKPDVVICSCVIDALCFKRRIPEALELFSEINERGCLPNVSTYNSLIKHLCKIRRMDKVYELLDEMELKKGSCLPNERTYNYLLKSLKKPEEVSGVLERMVRNGCEMSSDIYNLILKLYMNWDYEEKVRYTWDEMEKKGLGPDRRSYTIMIHGLYDKGRLENSLSYFHEMTSKGMVPEPRTEILVNAMNIKLKKKEAEHDKVGEAKDEKPLRPMHKRKKKVKTR